MAKMGKTLDLLLILLWCCWLGTIPAAAFESCVQLLGGHVGGGNYTYYRLAQEGEVTLSLQSVTGDADIYVSQAKVQPTWETEDNDLQSATCGEDRIDIPSHFRRPMGIGIYGHPSHDLSTYRLCVNLATAAYQDDRDYDYDLNSYDTGDDYAERSSSASYTQVPFRGGGYDKDVGGEDESLAWSVIIKILKIVVESFM